MARLLEWLGNSAWVGLSINVILVQQSRCWDGLIVESMASLLLYPGSVDGLVNTYRGLLALSFDSNLCCFFQSPGAVVKVNVHTTALQQATAKGPFLCTSAEPRVPYGGSEVILWRQSARPRFLPHEGIVPSMAFLEDTLVTCSDTDGCRIWHCATGVVLQTLLLNNVAPPAYSFAASGNKCYIGHEYWISACEVIENTLE